VCSKKPSWFQKNQEGLVQTSQKNRSVQKKLLGLIIRVKKTKKVWLRLLKKIKCVQKNLLGFKKIHVKKTRKV
jgi:hypothetical protein